MSKKTQNNKGLGRGLASLLGDAEAAASINLQGENKSKNRAEKPQPKDAAEGTRRLTAQNLPIEKITPGPWQPRSNFDDTALDELAQSIKKQGIVQPILVRQNGENYQLIAGERRWRAAQRAGMHDIPAIIRNIDEKIAAEIAIVENIQRQDLNAIEEAAGYRKLIDTFNYTQDALAGIVGKSRSHIANMMRLLMLPEDVQGELAKGALTIGQLRPIIGRKDASEIAKTIKNKKMTARQVEAMINNLNKPEKSNEIKKRTADILSLEKEIANLIGFDVKLDYKSKGEKGMLKIKFSSLREFDEILKRFGKKKR